MTKPIKTIMVAMLAIMFTSCATFRDLADEGRPINLNAVKIGMTRVQAALNKKPDNVVAAKKYPETNTVVEVVQYTQFGAGNANEGIANAPTVPVIKERYWLYFVNDKLDKWEIAALDRKPRM